MYSLFCYITIIFIIISFLVFSILFIYIYILFLFLIFIFLKFLIIIYWILYLLIVIIIILFPFPKLNYNNYFNYFHITFSPHSLIFFPSLIVITHANVYECPTSWNLYVVYVLQGDQLDKPCFPHTLRYVFILKQGPGPWFNINMSSYQYRKSHCGDKTVVRSSYLNNRISYTGK